MNDSFLHNVAEIYYNHIVDSGESDMTIADVLFVFPNRRAGLFFKKEYCSIATRTTFAPNTTDINRFCGQLSHLTVANDVELLLRLYNSYKAVYAQQKSTSSELIRFEDFISQGNMMLADFDEIDKYLADASVLFQNIEELRALTIDTNFFSEAQLQAINSFWANAFVSDTTEGLTFQKRFISFWSLLYPIYLHFKTALYDDNIGYQGMLYRDVVEKVLPSSHLNLPFKRIVFIGFNVLTASEEAIMTYFQKLDMADFYFDYPEQYGRQSAFSSTAGLMYDTNLRKFRSRYDYHQPSAPQCAAIDLFGTPSATDECRTAAGQIHNIYKEKGENLKQLTSGTALILADESLLTETLEYLPRYISDLNVTMGYPLSQSPIATLIDNIILLQTESRPSSEGASFYHKPLINILTHPYIQSNHHKIATAVIRHITKYNFIRITDSSLHRLIDTIGCPDDDKALFKHLLSSHQRAESLFSYLTALLDTFLSTQSRDTKSNNVYRFETEYIIQYKSYLNQLKNILTVTQVEIGLETLHLLINRLTQNLKVQFIGEPLNGFQVMGMLESRLLDFDNIIILGFNDINIPGTKFNKSLIPYNLRRAYGLPTYEQSDAIYSYNFYRSLYRAKSVKLIYNSRDKDTNNEISRYYYQIKYLLPTIYPDLRISEHKAIIPIPKTIYTDETTEIRKTREITSELDTYRIGGRRTLSASALKTYIACPLKFYFNTIAHLKDADEITETDNAPLLGLIFHKAMELYYDKRHNEPITPTMIERLVTLAFEALKNEDKKGLELTGFNHLIFNVVCHFVELTLKYDNDRKPFTYLKSEEELAADFNGIAIKAYIDRSDITDHTQIVNILDYKTTKTPAERASYTFDLLNLINSTNKADHEIFQILFYCHIFLHTHTYPADKIKPNIYNLYDISKTAGNHRKHENFEDKSIKIKVPAPLLDTTDYDQIDFDSLKDEAKETIAVTSYNDIKTPFEYLLKHLFDEIFNPDIPFRPNPDDTTFKNCTFCPYIHICGNENKIWQGK